VATPKTQPAELPHQVANAISDTKSEFAKRVYKRMMDKGWNQSQLARYAGLPRDSISVYIRGRSLPTPQSLQKLAACLGCAPEELLSIYAQAAAEIQPTRLELREIHGEPDYIWIKLNARFKTETALKILMLAGQDELAVEDEADLGG